MSTSPTLYRKPWPSRPKALIRDAWLAAKNAPTLALLARTNKGERPYRSELSPSSYESPLEVAETLSQIVLPRVAPIRRKPYSRAFIASEGLAEPSKSEIWLYVNGVATAPAVLKANGKELARLFQRPIHLIHNPTDSLALDLWECVLGRTFDFKTDLAEYVLDVVARLLRGYERVVLIGHSQGGIVVANVLNSLVRSADDRTRLERLEIYTFGSAADEMLGGCGMQPDDLQDLPYCEHFANGFDFVARFGVIACTSSILGTLFVNESRTGHLLNAHYLPGFELGEYCGKKSRLYQYLGGGTPNR